MFPNYKHLNFAILQPSTLSTLPKISLCQTKFIEKVNKHVSSGYKANKELSENFKIQNYIQCMLLNAIHYCPMVIVT